MYESPRLLHPLQMCQPLSYRVSFDLSNHCNQLLPCPAGWDIWKRNAQVLIYDSKGHAIGVDSANHELLDEWHGPASAPTELFLQAVLASCMQQRTTDMDYYVQWKQHLRLLTCLQYVLEATCLVGARTVTLNYIFCTSSPRTPQI